MVATESFFCFDVKWQNEHVCLVISDTPTYNSCSAFRAQNRKDLKGHYLCTRHPDTLKVNKSLVVSPAPSPFEPRTQYCLAAERGMTVLSWTTYFTNSTAIIWRLQWTKGVNCGRWMRRSLLRLVGPMWDIKFSEFILVSMFRVTTQNTPE